MGGGLEVWSSHDETSVISEIVDQRNGRDFIEVESSVSRQEGALLSRSAEVNVSSNIADSYNDTDGTLDGVWRCELSSLVRVHLKMKRAVVLDIAGERVSIHVLVWRSDELPSGSFIVSNVGLDFGEILVQSILVAGLS